MEDENSTGGGFFDFIRDTTEGIFEAATPAVQSVLDGLARQRFGQPDTASTLADNGQVPANRPAAQQGLLSNFSSNQILIGGGAIALTVIVLAIRK